MNITEARASEEILIGYLAGRGCHLARRGDRYWTRSPMRDERTASFLAAPCATGWHWRDFGDGDARGTIIDLVMKGERLASPGEALRWLNEQAGALIERGRVAMEAAIGAAQERGLDALRRGDGENPLQVLSADAVTHRALVQYVRDRGISAHVADTHLREVHWVDPALGKTFFGVGVRNAKGGWEVRNAWWKGVVGAKDIAWLSAGEARTCDVVEGPFDGLALIDESEAKGKVLVLNGCGMAKRAAALLARVPDNVEIRLHLDADKAGRDATAILQEAAPRALDVSGRYDGYEDVADRWRNQRAF